MNSEKKILIIGVNGFIGSALAETLLKTTPFEIYGLDLTTHKIEEFIDHPRFHFFKGNMIEEKEWIQTHIQKCDVIIPLAAVANPSIYVTDPLFVFELDFEANLPIVRACVEYKKRLIFPSTSEVYGMCQDEEFDEFTSPLTVGPVPKQRWIYSSSKQLMDRLIYAYGLQRGLDYTLFRPFNWLGPKLDQLIPRSQGQSRVVTQFMADILYDQKIFLVDGGVQRRSFTDIQDGIDALVRIIENPDGKASQQIFNIGNPRHDISIKELADLILSILKTYPSLKDLVDSVRVIDVVGEAHYGQSYQDIQRRVPKIEHIRHQLGWEPKVPLKESLTSVIEYHVNNFKNHKSSSNL